MKGDYAAARRAFEIGEPRFFDPDQWQAAIEAMPGGARIAGMLLLRTGDGSLGQQLLDSSVD